MNGIAREWVQAVLLCFGLAAVPVAEGQTRLDLKNQGRSVDFTGATMTKPVKSGVALPLQCQVGEMYFKLDSPAGTNLHTCASPGVWSQVGKGLVQLSVQRSDEAKLLIGADCGLDAPCLIRQGALVRSYSANATVTISGGTGVAYIYVASTGAITVGHEGLTLECVGGCTVVGGITGFPADSVPLYRWNAVGGIWAEAGEDSRAALSTVVVKAGMGLVSLEQSGQVTLYVDSGLVGLRSSAPLAVTDACNPGNWAMDTAYFYVCVSENTWKRTALSEW